MQTSLIRLRRWLLKHFVRSLGTRRQRIMAWELMAKTGVHPVRFTRHGLTWNIQLLPYDDIAWYLFVDGGFQDTQIQAVLAWAQHFGVFSGSRNVLIDVGANIGTTCIPIVHSTGCRALAIEPVAANFFWLRQNVESNAFTDKILLANNAIALRPGKLRMCLTPTSGGHFVADGENTVEHYEDVDADTLFGVVAAAGLDAGEIALVWSDVQGSELAVIESGGDLWARGVPLWAEVEPHSLRRQGTFDIFAAAVAAHFDRFIDARDLINIGPTAVPRPIEEFASLVAGITPEQINTDVLLLPPGFNAGPR
jgi:FkbM family methyltransferase